MVGHIFINGEIGVHTTPESFRAQINPSASEYILHFNSEGGDVYDGYQMGNSILNIDKPTTAIVEGLCASIATYMACCADKIIMTPQATWVIHDPTASTSGGAKDLVSAASQLIKMKSEIIARYMTKVGRNKISPEQLSEAMARETSLGSDEAKRWGFADEVQEKLKAVAKINIEKFNMEKISQEQSKTLFENIEKKLNEWADKFIGKTPKPKAIAKPGKIEKKHRKIVSVVTLTLTDGTTVNVNADDPNSLEGAVIAAEDGTALADGIYETTDGEELTVTGGTVTSVEEASDEPTDDGGDEMAKMKSEIDALKKQLAGTAEAKVKMAAEYEQSFKAVKKEIEDFKAKTFGDPAPPIVKPLDQHSLSEEQKMFDVMPGFFEEVISNVKDRGFNVKI